MGTFLFWFDTVSPLVLKRTLRIDTLQLLSTIFVYLP